MKKKIYFNLPLIILIAAVVAGLMGIGLYRIEIDTDIIGTLPVHDPVISDARYVIMNHPAQDQLVIDVSHQKQDQDILVEAGRLLEKKLMESGLFKSAGMKEIQNIIPELIFYIMENLPVLFTERDLNSYIKPLLEPAQIRKKLKENFSNLLNLEGIGQSELISRDPLGFRNIVLTRLSHLFPSQNAQIYRGQLLSSDGRHLLLIARPATSGTDTTFARQATKLINNLSKQINEQYADQGYKFTLTPVGAYRAALDNELMAKGDIKKVILFSMLGIAFLLIIAFPRPYIGLLSFLPAIAGTCTAFFIFSLFNKSISILTIGFGGAIISITVDHGIAYLLFLDRTHETSGKEAAREIWAVGLLSTLTTVGAFSVLCISGFPVLAQIGQFAALGIAFSFLFVHTIFPLMFPSMPPVKKQRALPLKGIVSKLALSGGKYKAWAALAFAVVMLCFAKPEFHVDLRSMNTVSKETKAAESLVANVWGNIFSRIFLMTEGSSVKELQRKSDGLSELLEQEVLSGTLLSAFIPSMIFPGEEKGKENFSAWKSFWNKSKVRALKDTIKQTSLDLGFAAGAFNPFFNKINKPDYSHSDIPERFYSIVGISGNKNPDGSAWIQFSTITPGRTYNAESFYLKYASIQMVRLFDPKFFSERLGKLLSSTFLKMVIIIGISVVILMFVFFFDLTLTVVALMPILFAFVCTLGTLKLIGHPLDIPALMLSIVVMGMGIDYSLFFVRSYQRYFDENHTSLGLIRMAVFLASLSTLIGFGVLNFADHSMLKSAGLTSFLGIGYSLIGAFAILPPVLKHLFAPVQLPEEKIKPGAKKHLNRIIKRYRHLEAFVRISVRLKAMFDPMFTELSLFFKSPKIIIDIGSRYALPAVSLLESFPNLKVYGIWSDYHQARISSRAVGQRGLIKCSRAPDIPQFPNPADCAMMIDMIHYLKDDEFKLTLERLSQNLRPEGRLVIRAAPISQKGVSLLLRLEKRWLNMLGKKPYYRATDEIQRTISRAGFEIEAVKPSGSGRKGYWFLAKLKKGSEALNNDQGISK